MASMPYIQALVLIVTSLYVQARSVQTSDLDLDLKEQDYADLESCSISTQAYLNYLTDHVCNYAVDSSYGFAAAKIPASIHNISVGEAKLSKIKLQRYTFHCTVIRLNNDFTLDFSHIGDLFEGNLGTSFTDCVKDISFESRKSNAHIHFSVDASDKRPKMTGLQCHSHLQNFVIRTENNNNIVKFINNSGMYKEMKRKVENRICELIEQWAKGNMLRNLYYQSCYFHSG